MNVLYAVLLGVAFTIIELLIGGTRLLFSLPAYGVLALIALLSLIDLRRPKLPPDGWCLGASAVFFGYVLARAYFSPVAYIASEDAFMVGGSLIVYLLTACYFTDPRRRVWVLSILMALAAVNLVVGARQFAEGSGYMLFGFIRSSQYLGRASGLYICPDHLAGFLEMLTCLGLAMACFSRLRGWARLLFGYGSLMCLAGLVLTASRGGAISVCAGLTVLTLLGLGRVRTGSPEWFWRTVLLVLVLVGLAASALTFALARSHLLETRFHDVAKIQTDDRPRLWLAALEQFQLAPVFGTGSSTYLYYGRMLRDPVIQTDPIRSHNDYLELLAEYGLAGGVGLLLFLGAHLRWGWKTCRYLSLRRNREPGGSNAAAWNVGALSAVTCLLVHSGVDFNLHIPANTMVMAFIFGVLANPGRGIDPDRAQVARLRRIDWLPRLALPALGIWIAAAGLPTLPGEWDCEQARVALRDGHPAAALDLARRGIERESGNPYLYFFLGQARQALGGNGPDAPVARSFRLAAAQAYGDALRLAPMDVNILVRQGEMLTRLGDYDAADDVFRGVRHWDPHSAYAQTYYGFYLQARGLLPEAEAAYDRAAKFAPDSALPRNLADLERTRAATSPDQ